MNTPVQELEEQLHAHYCEEFGEPLSSSAFWSTLVEHLPEREHPQSWWQRRFQAFSAARTVVSPAPRRMSARRLTFAFSLALVALFVVGGVLFTANLSGGHPGVKTHATGNSTQLLSALVQSDARFSSLLFTQVDQVKSVAAGTVTLQKVYADANNVVLGYTFDGHFDPKGGLLPTITLSDRQTLKAPLVEMKQEGQKIAVLAHFDGSVIQGNPQQVQLNISIPTGHSSEHFQQTVPFTAGKTVKVNQTVTSNGQSVTLDRVVITPSESRFYYANVDMNQPFMQKLSINGQQISSNEVGFSGAAFVGGENYLGFWKNLQNDTGTWTVSDSILTAPELGTWQFTFTVA